MDFTFLKPDELRIADKSLLVGIDDIKYLDLIRMSLTVLLHILHCNQEATSYELTFAATKTVLEKFGAKIFLISADDSLQDWLRISLRHCCSQDPSVAAAAVRFIIYLLHSCFHYMGSFTVVSNTALAVINDVIDKVLEVNRSFLTSYADEDRVLYGLNSLTYSMEEIAFQRSNEVLFKDHSTISVAFLDALQRFARNLKTVLVAHGDLRRHLSHPVGYDFLGANLLDPLVDDPRVMALLHGPRDLRKLVKGDSSKRTNNSQYQIEEVMTHLLEASEVYDVIALPRFRMFWLENLARLHELKLNRSESAEIRWRIYSICVKVDDTWRSQWVPRPPLEWNFRQAVVSGQTAAASGNSVGGTTESVATAVLVTSAAVAVSNLSEKIELQDPHALPSAASAANGNTPISVTTAVNSSHVSRSYSNSIAIDTNKYPASGENRNFLSVFTAAVDRPPLRAWADNAQYLKHMEIALAVVSERYFAVSLVHLAERASNQLMTLFRMTNRTDLVVKEYSKIVNALKTVSDKGITSSMAIGSFYRVFYEGSGDTFF